MFVFSSRRRHTRWPRDWSSDVCSSDLKALEKSQLPVDSVQLIEDTSREKAKDFFRMNDYLDVLIPRGSEKLIEVVLRESTVPVIETGAGNCHLFVDASADPKMAKEIVLNAKLQRPSVCNAIEAVLIEKSWFEAHGLDLIERLAEKQVAIFGDHEISQLYEKASVITEEDRSEERRVGKESRYRWWRTYCTKNEMKR